MRWSASMLTQVAGHGFRTGSTTRARWRRSSRLRGDVADGYRLRPAEARVRGGLRRQGRGPRGAAVRVVFRARRHGGRGGVSGAGGCAAARCRTVQARGAVAQALRRVRSARRGQARLGGLRFVLLRHHLRCPARGAASGDHAGDHASRAPISDLGRCRPDGLGRRYLPQAVPTCAEGRGAGERQRRWLPDGERARPVHVRPHGDLAPRADAALRQAARS